jgi:hypothetical protein
MVSNECALTWTQHMGSWQGECLSLQGECLRVLCEHLHEVLHPQCPTVCSIVQGDVQQSNQPERYVVGVCWLQLMDECKEVLPYLPPAAKVIALLQRNCPKPQVGQATHSLLVLVWGAGVLARRVPTP